MIVSMNFRVLSTDAYRFTSTSGLYYLHVCHYLPCEFVRNVMCCSAHMGKPTYTKCHQIPFRDFFMYEPILDTRLVIFCIWLPMNQTTTCTSLEPRRGGGEKSAWYPLFAHALNYYIKPRGFMQMTSQNYPSVNNDVIPHNETTKT